MSDHEPLEPTRVDTTAIVAPSGGPPPSGEPPIPGGPPPGGPPPGEDPRDRNLKIAIGVVAAVVVLLIGALILTLGDDDSDVDTASPTTTEASTTSTTEATTTTTTEATTTSTTEGTTTSTTEQPDTECSGLDGPPDDASPVAREFMDAWQTGDAACADALATPGAVDTMFATEPGPTPQTFQGCTPIDEGAGEIFIGCTFTFEGGSTLLKMDFGALDGWRIFDVIFVSD